jgi:hypothetical protein
MKLSEAMRIGAKLRPQGFGYLFQLNENDQVCSCAIGAAAEGLLGTDPFVLKMGLSDVKEKFPQLGEHVPNPGREGATQSLKTVIIHLNDEQEWTREEIADWLEGIGY